MSESEKLQAYTTDEALAAKQKLADMVIEAKLVPKGMTTEQVILVMQKGHELGIPPTEALASMYVINGRVTLEGEAMLGLIYNSGKCAGIEFEAIRAEEPDKQGWAVTMRRSDMDVTHREVFTLEDAKRVRVKENGEWITLDQKFVWKGYPRIMCRWRAIAACARIVFPDIIGGLYLPEELGAPVEVSENGAVFVPPVEMEIEDGEEAAPEISEELIAEANELGALLGYSAAKIRTEINKAGPEHIGALIDEWCDAVAMEDQQEAAGVSRPNPDFDKPHKGSVERLDLGGDE